MKKPKPRELNYMTQGHTASKWQIRIQSQPSGGGLCWEICLILILNSENPCIWKYYVNI